MEEEKINVKKGKKRSLDVAASAPAPKKKKKSSKAKERKKNKRAKTPKPEPTLGKEKKVKVPKEPAEKTKKQMRKSKKERDAEKKALKEAKQAADDGTETKKKKNKKKKNKKEKEQKAQENKTGNITATSEAAAAPEEEKVINNKFDETCAYLYIWKNNRELWKFRKVRQSYLLKHKFNPQKLPKKFFKIFLDYIDGLKGAVRTNTMEECTAIVDAGLDNSEVDTNDPEAVEKQKLARIRLQRATQIVKVLC